MLAGKGAPSLALILLLTVGLVPAFVATAPTAHPSRPPVQEMAGNSSTPVRGIQQYTLYPNQYIPFAADAHYNGTKLKFQISAPTALDIYVMTAVQEDNCCRAGFLYHWSAGNISEEVPLPGTGLFYLVVSNDLSDSEVRFQAWSTTVPVDITLGHSAPPAPVGIVDYGVETSGGNATAYQLEMSAVGGTALLNAAQAYASAPPSGASPYGAGLQLNVELRVNATSGSYVYWLQNALLFYTNNDTANFNDNVWNQTTPTSGLDSTHVSGQGSVQPTPRGQAQPNYYGYATQYFNYTYPLDVRFLTTVSHAGDTVSVAFESTRGAKVSEQIQPQAFDTVRITEPGTISDASIIVSGFETTPFGSYFDAELVFGGNCCGAVTSFSAMNSTLAMSYVLNSGSVMAPTSLFEYGSDTGEGVSNLAVTPSANQIHGATYQVEVGTTDFTANFVRQAQAPVPIVATYAVLGEGYTGALPSIAFVVNGTEIIRGLSRVSQTFYADSGTAWQIVTSPSTSTERLGTTQATGGTVSGPQSINITFYHQFLVVFNFTIAGGGNGWAIPDATYKQFGSATTVRTGFPVWADAGSTYSLPSLLNGSTSSERWISNSTSGVISTNGTVNVDYQHQYYVTVGSSSGGGTVSPSTGWYDAGGTIHLVASPQVGWVLGMWNGTGASSYSGSEVSTDVQADGPITEQATFYPGLTIISSGSGTVGYSFADAQAGGQGSVPPGSTKTVYVPIDTMVTVTATSASLLFSFEGWSGNVSGAQATKLVLVDAPTSAIATFGYNQLNIGIVLVVVVVVLGVAIAAYVLVRSRSSRGRATEL